MIISCLADDVTFSPNTEPRRGNRSVDMLVLHYTGMISAEAALALLCNPQSGVSCHYLIDTDGRIIQMVGEELRAWHAGMSFWKGETDTNSRSIGIEIQNPGHHHGYSDFPMRQTEAVTALCHDILSRHVIPPEHVLAHSDVAPGRKIDPGEKFDWGLLAEQGIGRWVKPASSDPTPLDAAELRRFQTLLSHYGYAVGATGELDERTSKVTDAFSRHFRQALVSNLPDRSLLATAEQLIT